MKLRVLLIGGGSGGHLYPLVAVSEQLRRLAAAQGSELVLQYFGDPGVYGDYLRSKGIPTSWIPTSKLRRYASVQNILDIFRFFGGFIVAMVKVFFFMPDAVFSKSGPGTLPILFACRWYRIPVILHEADSIPGLTNVIAAKHAQVVEVAFEFAKKFFKTKAPVNVIGNPVRSELVNTKSAATCRAFFKLPDSRPILFIFGGSLGATRLNYFFLDNSERILSNFEVIHQVGRDNYETFKKEYEFMSKNYRQDIKDGYRLTGFLNDEQMAAAYGAADIVLSRAGSSIFEIAANGKPAILVPLPEAANNHQRENAYAFAASGAGIVIEEENLLPAVFLAQANRILQDREQYEKMRQSSLAFYKPRAAEAIAVDVLAAAAQTYVKPAAA